MKLAKALIEKGKQCPLNETLVEQSLTLSLSESITQANNVVRTFESVDKILWYDHSNETSLTVLLHSTVCFSLFDKINLGLFLNFDVWYCISVLALIARRVDLLYCPYACVVRINLCLVMKKNKKQKRSQARQSKTASNTKSWLRVKQLINANCPFQIPKIVVFKSCSAYKKFPLLSTFESCLLNKSLIVLIF